MTDEEVLDGIRVVAREHLDHHGAVERSTPLVEALELDSIRMLTLVVEVENHFEICLEEGDEEGIETVGDLVTLLQARLG